MLVIFKETNFQNPGLYKQDLKNNEFVDYVSIWKYEM